MSTCWHNDFGKHHPAPTPNGYRCANCGRRCSPFERDWEPLVTWGIILLIIVSYLYVMAHVLFDWFQ